MTRLRFVAACAVVFAVAFAVGAATAQEPRQLRPISELQWLAVEEGGSYWQVARDYGLTCTGTELWQFNARAPLDPGTGLLVPPWCATATVPPTTSTTTIPATTTTTTTLPVPLRRVAVGATVDRRGTETHAQATATFEAQTGGPVMIGRRFTPGFPTTFASVGSFAQDTGLRDRFISVKGVPTLAAWTAFLRSIPTDGFHTWVTINHEPENDGGSMTPSVFRGKLALMLQAIRDVGRADIHASLVLMGWHELDGNPATSSALWFPDDIEAFTLGLDPYDTNGRSAYAALVDQTLALWEAAGGGPYMITEVATKRTGADGVAWVRTMFDHCRADEDCEAVMYFHSAVGAQGPWWLDDPLMRAEWGRQARLSAA